MDRLAGMNRQNIARCAPGQHDFRVVLVKHVRRGDAVYSDARADGLAFACSTCGERG